jgi:hypothetical protein
MTRVASFLVAALMVSLSPGLALASSAALDHAALPPVVTRVEWADPPIHAADPACEVDCHVELLIVEAFDPNSAISEVQVSLGEGQAIILASTGCVQGKQPSTLAHLEIPATYLASGTFTVQVQAFSQPRCIFSTPHQASAVVELVTEVLPAP